MAISAFKNRSVAVAENSSKIAQVTQMRQRSPIEEALEDFNLTKDENAALKAESQQLKDMNVGLMQENALLRDRIDAVELDRDRYKAYSFELSTRLDVIVETIDRAKDQASRMSLKVEPPAPPKPVKVQEPPVNLTLTLEQLVGPLHEPVDLDEVKAP